MILQKGYVQICAEGSDRAGDLATKPGDSDLEKRWDTVLGCWSRGHSRAAREQGVVYFRST
jgi:hypothetical protein